MSLERTHVVPYPFPMVPTIEGKITGGLPAVFAAEFEANRTQSKRRVLQFLSTDSNEQDYAANNVKVSVASESADIPPFQEWFSHRWAFLHPNAHTAPYVDSITLSRMYAGEYDNSVGSLQQMVEHCQKYPAPDQRLVENFTARFRPFMEQVSNKGSDAIVNWQDPLFFAELQQGTMQKLRDAGIYQTCHVHTVLPDSLDASPWGESMVDVLRNMDVVFVHTEGYRTALENILVRQQSKIMPEIRRFDLMIDTPLLQKISDDQTDIHMLNDYKDLTVESKHMVDEVLLTKEGSQKVPHRFICLDRADPGKGITVLIDAIDQFLEAEMQKGLSISELRKKYRFFGFHDQLPQSDVVSNEFNLKEQYAMVVGEKYRALQDKYPGIVWCGQPITKTLAIRLMDDCNSVTACIHDGLNLAWPETVWVNAHKNRNRFGVMAQGAGFAQEAIRLGHATPEFFPKEGDSAAFAKGISLLVQETENDSSNLLRLARAMSDSYINTRKDSVIINK